MTELSDLRKQEIEFMPWTRRDDNQEAFEAKRQELLKGDKHDIAEGVAIADGAQVHCEELSIGTNTYIASGALVRGHISIGENCSVNPYTQISGHVSIGRDVRIASLVTIVGFNHGYKELDRPICKQPCTVQGISIGDDVWIGANVVICDGVKVGSHAILAAGSIIVRDVPDYAIVVGNPGRVIRDRRELDKAPATKTKTNTAESELKRIGEAINDEWSVILERAISEDENGKFYRDLRGHADPSRATCDAIEIAAGIGMEAPLHDRETYIKNFQAQQEDEFGLILHKNSKQPTRDGIVHLPDNYNILSVGYALECLGSHFKKNIDAIGLLNADEIYTKLENYDWTEAAWGGGSWTDSFGTALYQNLKHHSNTSELNGKPEIIFGWLDMHCNKATGMWGKPSDTQGWLQAVNGFYRLTRGTYAQFGRPLPHPEAAIDTILSHCHQNKDFIEEKVTACNVLDIIHPLWLCVKQTDYRKAEIHDLFERQVLAICKRWVHKEGFAFQPSEVAGLQGTEMWLSILAIAADYLGLSESYAYTPKGVHRLAVAHQL